ncbi:lipase family protein [Gorillibacterium sp. sgz5001074]|uniref:lipase family protein n=1 Tax=Gorillibacterium sp. sgz5001074 TaxID=3446695 RepID=UPI003F667083
MGRERCLLMSVFAYQAIQQYRSGAIRLPAGYRPVALLDGPGAPRLGFAAESAARYVLAFRGTEDWEDLRRDASFAQTAYPYVNGAGFTHRGFTELYASVREQVQQLIRRIPAGKPLYVTGHSLGGAIAALCALDAATSRRIPVYLYTFGSPKPGNADFASALDARVKSHLRIFNPKDLVTVLPPALLLFYRYEHGGRPVPLPFNRPNPFSNHSMAAYAQALCSGSSASCRKLCRRVPGLCP